MQYVIAFVFFIVGVYTVAYGISAASDPALPEWIAPAVAATSILAAILFMLTGAAFALDYFN